MRVLGVVEWVGKDRNYKPIGRVRPLLETTTPEWRPVAAEEFPSQGLVFWFHCDAAADSLVHFRPEDNPGQKDEFRVAEPQHAYEVLDVRSVGSSENVRAALASGLRLAPPIPPKALLWCAGDIFVGPLRLLTEDGTVALEKGNHHQTPHFRSLEVREVYVDRLRRLVVASSSLGHPSGHVDWDEDRLVLRRALEFAVSRAQHDGLDLSLTKRQIEEAATSIASASDASQLQLEAGRLDRAFSIVAALDQSSHLARDIVEILRGHPLVRQELSLAIDADRIAARTQLQQELAAERGLVEAAKSALSDVNAKVEAKRDELAEMAANREAELAAVETALAARLREVLKTPATVLAESAILRALIGGLAESPSGQEARVPPSRPSVSRWSVGERVLGGSAELRRCLADNLKARGVSSALSLPLHAAFQARLTPVLTGPSALAALEAYASVVAAGRLLVIHASASLVEPADIFGRMDVAGSRFIQHAGGLLDAVLAARESDGLMVVVIEGVNRGPIESYFLPLLWNAAGVGPSIPIFHPGTAPVSQEDQSRVDWPRNLLLAATTVNGPTTLPITSDLWAHAVLIQTDMDEESAGVARPPRPQAAEVRPAEFGMPDPSEFPPDLARLLEGTPLAAHHNSAQRFWRALQTMTSDVRRIRADVVRNALVPLVATIDEDAQRKSLVEHLAPDDTLAKDDLLRMVDAARKRLT